MQGHVQVRDPERSQRVEHRVDDGRRRPNGAFDLVISGGRIIVRFSSFDLAGLMRCAL
jgi:hypothetical protein